MKIFAQTLTYSNNSEIEIINELFQNKLDALHVNKPAMSKKELTSFINKIDPEYHSKIVLYQHHFLAKKFNCKAIHLKRKKLNSFFAKFKHIMLKLSIPNLRLTTTISPSSLRNSKDLEVEYALVGPIYKKYSEDNVRLLFDRFKLKKWISNSNIKSIAFGSIDNSNVDTIENLGFDGLILNSAIWRSHEPIEDFKEMILKVKRKSNNISSKAI